MNCVQFIVTVVEELLQKTLTPEERSDIMISNIREDEDLSTLVEENDPRTTGIRKALVSIGNGVIILPSEVFPGDFIQYWYKNNDSIWLGHSAVLESVEQSNSSVLCRLYGAHRSLGGVGVSQYKVNISDPGKKVYLVRFLPTGQAIHNSLIPQSLNFQRLIPFPAQQVSS